MEHCDSLARQTIFPKADSWYKGRLKDGREVFMPYVGGVGSYRETCDAVAHDGYRGFSQTKLEEQERPAEREDQENA